MKAAAIIITTIIAISAAKAGEYEEQQLGDLRSEVEGLEIDKMNREWDEINRESERQHRQSLETLDAPRKEEAERRDQTARQLVELREVRALTKELRELNQGKRREEQDAEFLMEWKATATKVMREHPEVNRPPMSQWINNLMASNKDIFFTRKGFQFAYDTIVMMLQDRRLTVEACLKRNPVLKNLPVKTKRRITADEVLVPLPEQQRQAAAPAIDLSGLPDQSPTSPIPDWAKDSATEKSRQARGEQGSHPAKYFDKFDPPVTTPKPTPH